jgi:ribonucleoside-diphosphate reductase alpha chain
MAILRVDHPDVGRFCVAKREEGQFSNFNISVGVTDTFYTAVRDDEPYALVSPRSGEQYTVTESTARFYSPEFADADEEAVDENVWRDHAADIPGIDRFRDDLRLEAGDRMTLPARFVWRLLVDGAWRNGEPGLFMVDEANHEHSFDVSAHPRHRIRATNPCGEQPLEQFEACNLGHVNLSLLVVDGAPRWPEFETEGDLAERMAAFLDAAIDWERLDRIVEWGMRFLDDVISVSEFPLAEIDEQVRGLRKVGLGVMGFADLLVQLGVRYGSDAAIEAADQLMAHIDHRAARASHDLATDRGSFDAWEQSKYADPTAYPEWFRRHTGEDSEEWVSGYAIRNHGQTSIAPTGTTSMIADASAGCEPLYGVVYFKNVSPDVQGEEMLVEFDDYFLQVLEANGLDAGAVRAEAADLLRSGEYEGLESLSIPEALAEPFATAFEVPVEQHVDVQAAFQRHVDGAVSKTINAPADADRAAIADAFERAIEADCKGLTVYRRGSREEQVLTTEGEEEEEPDDGSENCPGSGDENG